MQSDSVSAGASDAINATIEPASHIWHQAPTSEVVQLLDVDTSVGLSTSEAKLRLAKYGLNLLKMAPPVSALKRFLLQFNQPLVYILLAAVGVTGWLGEWVDASVIFTVVLINAIVGFIQEAKAEKAIDALSRMIVTEATVRRDDRKQRISSVELVPGDVVLLSSGDKVPADLRLFRVKNLQVDESALTGESLPVEKDANPLAMDTILAERKNLTFAGTVATYGQAEGVVWATGNSTETGRIAQLISEGVSLKTPLTQKIAQFSNTILIAILTLAAVAFAVGLWRGQPAAVTITLAVGVARMSRRKAIIRKLPAVETLGSVTVVCSDKTGTLTRNQMTVQKVFAGDAMFDVTGSGYEPKGEILLDGQTIDTGNNVALEECFRAGLLCNDTQLVDEEGVLEVEGDPTEAALLVASRKAGLVHETIHAAHARFDGIPFESQNQYMATLHDSDDLKVNVIYKKGAIETVLERCCTFLTAEGELAPIDRDRVRMVAETLASEGLRVLAIARKHVSADQKTLDHEHVTEGLTLLGLQGMIDPPRTEAIRAIARCHTAGILVKMITGDHLLTAQAVARQLGLTGSGGEMLAAISGRDLERLSDSDLSALAEKTVVFARVAPEQKLRLVKALQAKGHIVAMTGDGVNDAPALKSANIGIAMGQSGTDVAKGAADMLLLDDNFETIEAAVEEGRGIFAYHGYPWLIHRLTYRRTNHRNLHVRGYKEEGTTSTPFDMVVRNDLDRFHLVADVIDRVPRLGSVAAYAKQAMRDKLTEHKEYVVKHGEDMPEIRDWKWPHI
jgi:cation-transporting ATPase F